MIDPSSSDARYYTTDSRALHPLTIFFLQPGLATGLHVRWQRVPRPL